MGSRWALGSSLAGIGILVAVLLLIARKGPVGALVPLLAVCGLVLVLSVVSGFLRRKDR